MPTTGDSFGVCLTIIWMPARFLLIKRECTGNSWQGCWPSLYSTFCPIDRSYGNQVVSTAYHSLSQSPRRDWERSPIPWIRVTLNHLVCNIDWRAFFSLRRSYPSAGSQNPGITSEKCPLADENAKPTRGTRAIWTRGVVAGFYHGMRHGRGPGFPDLVGFL